MPRSELPRNPPLPSKPFVRRGWFAGLNFDHFAVEIEDTRFFSRIGCSTRAIRPECFRPKRDSSRARRFGWFR